MKNTVFFWQKLPNMIIRFQKHVHGIPIKSDAFYYHKYGSLISGLSKNVRFVLAWRFHSLELPALTPNKTKIWGALPGPWGGS